MCDNHDDGETAAIILCNMCGNLCTDCDRFLHLHRRTRSHQRQVGVELRLQVLSSHMFARQWNSLQKSHYSC